MRGTLAALRSPGCAATRRVAALVRGLFRQGTLRQQAPDQQCITSCCTASGAALSLRPLLAAALALTLLPTPEAHADAVQTSHGLSAFGDLKYPPDFEHFDYVNPDAPKGGSLSTVSSFATGTFDSLNGYILKGDAAAGVVSTENLIFDTLMVRAYDEPDAVYGLVAEHAELLPGQWIVFQMREEAEFSDGSPLTAEDAKATFDLLTEKGHPAYRLALKDFESAEVLGPHRIRYNFVEGAPTRLLPMVIATMPIFSKAYYEENDFTESSLDPPLGSGPYRVGKIVRDVSIEYERRDDYWAKDLPVNRGRWNFDTIRFEYFKDHGQALEALMAGELDLREEYSSKQWATQYDTPAIREGRIIRDTIGDDRPAGTQGYWINTRREKFQDPRVREAIALAFDFEWSNKALFYGLYKRTDSFFENSPFEASGEPTVAERKLLMPFADSLPQTVFGEAYVPPVTDGSGRARRNIRAAQKLLDEAGWKLVEGKRVDADGEPLTIEFLDDSATFARITNPYIQNLERLGIDATLRQVDRPQYQRRVKEFDFDIITARLVFTMTPGPTLANNFSSAAADESGSFNFPGIKDEAVDALIVKAQEADSRKDLYAALRAIDRILRDRHYWVPQWAKGSHTIAYKDKFGFPEEKPPLNRGILDTWWVDPAKDGAD